MKEVRTFMVPTLAFGAKRVARFEVPVTFMLPGVMKEVRTFMVSTLAFDAKTLVAVTELETYRLVSAADPMRFEAFIDERPAPFAVTLETLIIVGRRPLSIVPKERFEAFIDERPAPFAVTLETLMIVGRRPLSIVPKERFEAFKADKPEPGP
jgi:hypothetical protein